MNDHTDPALPVSDAERLADLKNSVAGTPAPVQGAFRARRTAKRRKAARVGGLALSVATLMIAVPLGLSTGGPSQVDQSLVASEESASPEPSVPSLPPLPSMEPRPLETPDNPLPVTPRPTPTTPPVTETVTEAPPPPVVSETPTPAAPPSPDPSNIDELEDNPMANVEYLPGMSAADLAAFDAVGRSEVYGGGDRSSFVTPSGNIQCAYNSQPADQSRHMVHCKATEVGWGAARPLDCTDESDWERSLVALTGSETQVGECGTDTPLKPNPIVLEYGRGMVANGLTCISLESGLICEDPWTGNGFKVNQERLQVW